MHMEAMFETLCRRWEHHLLDLDVDETASPLLLHKFSIKQKTAAADWNKLVKTKDRRYLWEEFPQIMIGENHRCGYTWDLTRTYRKVENLAWLWSHPRSVNYHNVLLKQDIIESLSWLSTYCYNDTLEIGIPFQNDYNWYELEIGTPMALSNILVLMEPVLSAEQLAHYLQVTEYFNPNPSQRVVHGIEKATGANLLWKAYGVVLRGILLHRYEELEISRNMLLDIPGHGKDNLFGLVVSGDGFYPDGSFVQHEALAYTGDYGTKMLYELSQLLILFHGCPWDFSADIYDRIYEMVEQSFEPLMDRGRMMDMVRGRGVGRQQESDLCQGIFLLGALVFLLPFYTGEKRKCLEAFIKAQAVYLDDGWLLRYLGDAGQLRHVTRNRVLSELLRLRADSQIPSVDSEYFKVFASMDRVVARRNSFALGLSMYSSRIADYECGSGENVRGWYTAYGMISTYDEDVCQYTELYWPTVNPYGLPGTTVNKKTRRDRDKGYLKDHKSSKSWVGGSSLGRYGTAGMWLEGSNSALTAKKSWFFFEQELVCLGTEIADDSGCPVETIVDNVRIYRDNRMVSSDGKVVNMGQTLELSEPSWLWLEGNTPASCRGYYFPEHQPVMVQKEHRTGTWTAVDHLNGTDDLLESSYSTIWLDHGKEPSDASYSYIMLPGISETQLRRYDVDCPVEVWANNGTVQAAAYQQGAVVGMNFWSHGECRGYVARQPLSLTVVTAAEAEVATITIGIADPTQLQEQLCLHLPYAGCTVIDCDAKIQVDYLGTDSIYLRINTKQSAGKTFVVRFQQDRRNL